MTFNKTDSEIIIVSGLPRSGTSLMMKMLATGGIPLLVDQVREADEDNPNGYFELEEVKQLKDGNSAWLSEAKGKAVKVIAPLLQFLPKDYKYKIIFMRRAMPEILASQKQMLIRRGKDIDGVPDETMARIFDKQVNEILAWINASPNAMSLEIPFTEVIANADLFIDKIKLFLQLELDMEKMAQVINPNLYRQRVS